jgi:hypothetical protein
LGWLTRAHREGQWIDSDLPGDGSRLWVNACTLARLSELPSEYISPALRQQVEMALNRLKERAVAGSGHRSQFEQIASTSFHFSYCSCRWRHFRRDRHEAGWNGPSSAYHAEVAS